MDKEIDELAVNIKELDKDIVKSNSFYRVFLRGVLWGVGTALGATIIAAVIITLFFNILNSIDYISILRDFLQKIQR